MSSCSSNYARPGNKPDCGLGADTARSYPELAAALARVLNRPAPTYGAQRDDITQILEGIRQLSQCPNPARSGPRQSLMGSPLTTLPLLTASTLVTITPNDPFTIHQVVIPSDIAGPLFINDLKIGGKTQIVQGPLPARAFTEASECCFDWDCDEASIAQPIVFDMNNTSGGAIVFSVALYGQQMDCR